MGVVFVYLYPKCISCSGEPHGSSQGVQTGIVVQTVVHFVPGLPGLANTFWIGYTRYVVGVGGGRYSFLKIKQDHKGLSIIKLQLTSVSFGRQSKPKLICWQGHNW